MGRDIEGRLWATVSLDHLGVLGDRRETGREIAEHAAGLRGGSNGYYGQGVYLGKPEEVWE